MRKWRCVSKQSREKTKGKERDFSSKVISVKVGRQQMGDKSGKDRSEFRHYWTTRCNYIKRYE